MYKTTVSADQMDDSWCLFEDSEDGEDDDGGDEEADQDERGAAGQDVGGRLLRRWQRRDRPRRRRCRWWRDARAAVGLHDEAELADADVEGVRRVALVEAFRRERTLGRLEGNNFSLLSFLPNIALISVFRLTDDAARIFT